MELYTLEDVSLRTGENGTRCWVVIRDIVYDFTDYLVDHPGGGELITEYAGRDGTKGFDDFGHSGDAVRMLKPYKIGELVEEDRKTNRKNPKASATNGIAHSNGKSTIFADEEIRKKRRFLFCR